MLKLRRLHAPPRASLQPIQRFRPRLVLARDEVSGSGPSKGTLARIVIVEDDYLISAGMEAELTAAGFDVIGVARSATEAVRLATDERPHLVIMDVGLEGGRDGVEAAIEIFNLCGIRSLFASAYHGPETRRRAEVCSPLGWVAKPYMMSTLVAAVHAALRGLGHYGDK